MRNGKCQLEESSMWIQVQILLQLEKTLSSKAQLVFWLST